MVDKFLISEEANDHKCACGKRGKWWCVGLFGETDFECDEVVCDDCAVMIDGKYRCKEHGRTNLMTQTKLTQEKKFTDRQRHMLWVMADEQVNFWNDKTDRLQKIAREALELIPDAVILKSEDWAKTWVEIRNIFKEESDNDTN